ncbi:MAG TPA: glycosyltransferase family A protein [Candidatus Binataceae bacterium]|nr:glycosyltransferase family A protein [Candidatus Binataceae bacterium]
MRLAVIIPVFNGATTVNAAITSALKQKLDEPFEVIVVDDGSTDATPEVLAGFDSKIKVVTQANGGLSAARNAGATATASDNEYLAFLDADDVWLPDKLASSLPPFDLHPEAVLLYTDVQSVDDQDSPLPLSSMPPRETHAPSMNDLLSRWWPIIPSTVVVRRSAFEGCGRFCESFRGAGGHEDVDFWLRMRELGEFIYLERSLVKYRVVAGANPMLKYQTNFELFEGRVTERYGRRGQPLLASMRHGYATALSHHGLMELERGDRIGARRAFLSALRYKPSHFKSVFRLARTFLPAALAQALASGSRRRGYQPDR